METDSGPEYRTITMIQFIVVINIAELLLIFSTMILIDPIRQNPVLTVVLNGTINSCRWVAGLPKLKNSF
jgi:hypothetical protein